MKKDEHLFEDLSKMAGSAMNVAFNSFNDAKDQVSDFVNNTVESYLQKMNLVSREEFNTVLELAKKAREENITLKTEIDKLKTELKKLSSNKK